MTEQPVSATSTSSEVGISTTAEPTDSANPPTSEVDPSAMTDGSTPATPFTGDRDLENFHTLIKRAEAYTQARRSYDVPRTQVLRRLPKAAWQGRLTEDEYRSQLGEEVYSRLLFQNVATKVKAWPNRTEDPEKLQEYLETRATKLTATFEHNLGVTVANGGIPFFGTYKLAGFVMEETCDTFLPKEAVRANKQEFLAHWTAMAPSVDAAEQLYDKCVSHFTTRAKGRTSENMIEGGTVDTFGRPVRVRLAVQPEDLPRHIKEWEESIARETQKAADRQAAHPSWPESNLSWGGPLPPRPSLSASASASANGQKAQSFPKRSPSPLKAITAAITSALETKDSIANSGSTVNLTPACVYPYSKIGRRDPTLDLWAERGIVPKGFADMDNVTISAYNDPQNSSFDLQTLLPPKSDLVTANGYRSTDPSQTASTE